VSVEGARILVEQMDGLQTLVDEGIINIVVGDQWDNISTATQQTLVNEQYYDMNGLQMQDLTFFFTNAQVQEEFTPYGTQGFYLIDLITTTKLSRAEIQEASIPDLSQTRDLPGFLDSNFRSGEVVLGQQRYYHASADLASQITLAGQSTWGTCTASASDRIYVTRIVYLTEPLVVAPAPGEMSIPPANIVVTGVIAEEDEGDYQMRLHRSLQIYGQP